LISEIIKGNKLRKSRHHQDNTPVEFSWRSVKSLIPYLMEHKSRVVLALTCLVLAKVAIVGLPFILKEIVDSLEQVNDGLTSYLSFIVRFTQVFQCYFR
jgi:ABC-type multidrug transport system fused ATPase/permease subunit